MIRPMSYLQKVFLVLALLALPVSLSACQAIDSTMNSMHEVFNDILPQQSPPQTEEAVAQDRQENLLERPPEMRAATAEADMAETDMAEADMAETDMAGADIAEAVIMEAAGIACPDIDIVEDLNALHQFTNPDRPSPGSLISSIYMMEMKSNCSQIGSNLAVDIDLTFEGKLGPRARVWDSDKPSFAYPYFIALTTPDGSIAAKEVFAATVTYENSEDITVHHENIHQVIPLNGVYNTDHEVLIGFQLSEGELAYNRSLRGDTNGISGMGEQYIAEGRPEPDTAQQAVLSKPAPILLVPPQKPQPPQTETAAELAVTESPATAEAPAPASAPSPAPVQAEEQMQEPQATSQDLTQDLTEDIPVQKQAVEITADVIEVPEMEEMEMVIPAMPEEPLEKVVPEEKQPALAIGDDFIKEGEAVEEAAPVATTAEDGAIDPAAVFNLTEPASESAAYP